jgi:hypothetical protein
MHMVRACLPWALALRKKIIQIEGDPGQIARSSSRVKRGKKDVHGGSITEIYPREGAVYPVDQYPGEPAGGREPQKIRRRELPPKRANPWARSSTEHSPL